MIQSSTWSTCIRVGVLGALSAMGHWHPSLWLVSFIALCGLIRTFNHSVSQPLQAYSVGLSWGLGYYLFTCHWLITPLSTVAQLPSMLSYALLLLFFLIMAQTIAFTLYCAHRFSQYVSHYTAITVSWVFMEWLLTQSTLSFPWALLGYAFVESPWAYCAPYGGVFMVSGVILLSSIYLTQPIHRIDQVLLKIFLILLLSFIPPLSYTHPTSNLSIKWVEGYRSPLEKWHPTQQFNALKYFIQQSPIETRPALLIWPEGALPWLYNTHNPDIQHLNHWIRTHNLNLITGIFNQEQNSFFNSALFLTQHRSQLIHKHFLVPLGEYWPLPSVVKHVLHDLSIPYAELSVGKNSPLIHFNGHTLLTLICYEIAFPQWIWTHSIQSQASIVITDDSWFDSSIAIQEHLNITRMRMLETQKPFAFVNDTGHSQILDILPQANTPQRLTLRIGHTPVVQWGMVPMIVMLTIILLFEYLVPLNRRKDSSLSP